MDSIRAAARLWKSPRLWALLGALGGGIPVLVKVGLSVADWADERASVTEVRALDLRAQQLEHRALQLEHARELQREQQRAAFRELAAAWALERVPPVRRGAVVTAEQRDAAAERARQHFNRLLVRGYDEPEALRVALRQVEAAR